MHITDHPSQLRLGVLNWLVLAEDERIVDTRVELYCIAGTVKEAVEFLESRVKLDYYVAEAAGPPELRFDSLVEDADDYPPAPPIFLNDSRIADNWCHLFGDATTRQLMKLPTSNFLEFEGVAKTVHLAVGFMLGADGMLERLNVDLSEFVEPLPHQ